MTYHPPKETLEKYANVLVNFALNSGKGVKKGEVVYLQVPECAKPLLIELQKTILKAGAHYITNYLPDNTARHFYELAEEHHLDFFPHHYLKGRVEQADHFIMIIAETDKRELQGIAPEKIMKRTKAFEQYKKWRDEKENQGKLTWTLALYGTEAMAKEASLSLEEYWQQIINACFLSHDNPLKTWNEVFAEVDRVKDKLNSLQIEKLRVIAEGTDLIIKLGKNRTWMGGSGRNIPSFEVFISPDYRHTEGKIRFNQPAYHHGNLIKNIKLEFKDGKIIKAEADEDSLLKEILKVEGADQIGEYSLTDSRLSHITKFMAETLYDENLGGEHGNTHIAIGSAYKDSYPGNPAEITDEQWEEMGYNSSVIHMDFISTENRKIIATLSDGKELIIYENGKFSI